MRIQAVIPAIAFKPATPDTNARDLTRFKLTAKEKNAAALKNYTFTIVNLDNKSFLAPSS